MEGGFLSCRTHTFGHKNIVYGTSDWEDKSGCRNFDTLEEHDDFLVNNINSNIGEEDVFLCLGDWSFGGYANVRKFRDRVNCKRILLTLGNHDIHIMQNPELKKLFFWVGTHCEFRYNHEHFVCGHYPLGSWNNMARGSINLYGHCHNSYNSIGRQIDCCPENLGGVKSLEDIQFKLNNVSWKQVDHHNPNSGVHF